MNAWAAAFREAVLVKETGGESGGGGGGGGEVGGGGGKGGGGGGEGGGGSGEGVVGSGEGVGEEVGEGVGVPSTVIESPEQLPTSHPLPHVPDVHSAGSGHVSAGPEGMKEHVEGDAIEASSLGTVPDSRLPCSSSFFDTISVAISVGIVPEMVLLDRKRWFLTLRKPICVGSVPETALSLQLIVFPQEPGEVRS